jgi:hypothetical protein
MSKPLFVRNKPSNIALHPAPPASRARGAAHRQAVRRAEKRGVAGGRS